MRHAKKDNHLGRTTAHRKALLSNLASSLIMSEKKRIITTLAKARELRRFVEPLVTKSRANTTHSRRVVFSNLQDKDAVTELFTTIAPKTGERPGGYTRILKLGKREGDNAELALIEFVDFNEFLQGGAAKKAATTRRRKKAAPKKSAGAEGGAEAAEKPAKKASKKSAPKAEAAEKPAAKKASKKKSEE